MIPKIIVDRRNQRVVVVVSGGQHIIEAESGEFIPMQIAFRQALQMISRAWDRVAEREAKNG